MPATLWERTKTSSKAGFDKVYAVVDKLGAPVNRLSNKLGSEAFWPTTLDKESDKAARILRSFCKDGFYQEEVRPSADGPKSKQRVLKKIPAEVIRNAKGLAIFTTMRTGLWVSGAGGSGVLVGRKEDGTWSPPSGIMLHTAGLGFLVGVDIYDCVVVINTDKALEAFSKIRCTLGGEISAVAGPVGMGGVLETELHKRQAPLFTYLKSRGFYAGVQIDGTIIIERTDENKRFYGERISVGDILKGKVRHAPYETRKLLETIKAAQGDTDVDENLLPDEPPPGDFEIESRSSSDTKSIFGVPDQDDPDPFGVLALEKAGLEIREAGTHEVVRPSSQAFSFNPSPSSPLFPAYSRHSMDGRSIISRRSSWRTSTLSALDKGYTTSSAATQTDFDETPPHLPSRPANGHTSRGHSPPTAPRSPMNGIPEVTTTQETSQNDVDKDKDDDDHEEPVVVHGVAAAQQVVSRARLVTLPKRPPPPALPPRNPGRSRNGPLVINADPNNPIPSVKDQSTGPHSNPHSPDTPTARSPALSRTSSLGSISSGEVMTAEHEGITKLHHEDDDSDGRNDSGASVRRGSREVDEFHSVPQTPSEPASPHKAPLDRDGFSDVKL